MNIKELFKTKEGKEFKEHYTKPNFLDIIGLFRYEDANTNFLKSFLDYKEDIFGLGKEPLINFIKLIAPDIEIEDFQNNLTDNIEFKVREKIINSNLRPDLMIFINNKYFILLEAKLESLESKDQCKDYYEKTKDFYKYPNKIYTFLSLEDNLTISSDNYKKITYQDLIDNLYEKDYKNLNEIGKFFLEEYLNNFFYLVKKDLISSKLKMPITKKDRELANNLYNNNEELINTLLESPNILKEENEATTLFKILLIILYNISDNEKLKRKIYNIKYLKNRNLFIMYDDNKYITSSSIRITKEIVKILMQKFKIEEINSLLNDDNLELLYTKEEFKTLKFSKTVKNWYDDMEINNKKYKLLVSFRYYEMKAFLENVNKFVDDKNFKLGIVVKAKNDGNILLG